MDEKEAKEIFQKIIDMRNVVSDLQHNTVDAEMSRYFMGFMEALEYVEESILRKERIQHHLIISQKEG